FPAVRFPGTVLWCNFELARELGFNVPRTNHLTPELHEELLDKLSLRAVTPGDDVPDIEVVKMYADRYGGDGVSPALGAGRAGFLREGNLYIKGLGFTPLFRHNDKDDFVHSHGGVHLEDCMSEAVFGEVNQNLFELGSSRLVAIIDQGMFVTEPSGRRRDIALAIRTGTQLRPGHLLAKRVRGSRSPLEMFVSITRATGQLVFQNGSGTPDLGATMLSIIDDHARTAAGSFRWRMIHGALSPSNMDVSGAMLDLPTQSTQPRTAPIFSLDYVHSSFGTEHKERGFYLAEMYRRILRTTDAPTRERFNLKWLNVSNQMDSDYAKYLQLKLVGAAGFKAEFATRICTENSDAAARFCQTVLTMAALKNAGSACVARKVVEDVCVVDVFNVLGNLPAEYFNGDDLTESVLRHARPVFKGNRFHVRAKERKVEQLAAEFSGVYRELMNVASVYYPSRSEMERSITSRAVFENQPLEALYCFPLYQELNAAIAEYKTTGNAQIISDAIDTRITRSLRSVDALLARGSSLRTIRGISYSVRAGKLNINIPVEARGDQFVTAVPGLDSLTKRQIRELRYRFTTDRAKTFHEARGRLLYDEQLGAIIDFGDLETVTLVGYLEGFFVTTDLRTRTFSDYVFAIPD
ncbi:MAG TPA: hypothetical protein VFO72_05865, partial [Pyrinomonadaceae bacterium]|nr:hypothetical protein [Pyrinomonadaceae bacterium]